MVMSFALITMNACATFHGNDSIMTVSEVHQPKLKKHSETHDYLVSYVIHRVIQ